MLPKRRRGLDERPRDVRVALSKAVTSVGGLHECDVDLSPCRRQGPLRDRLAGLPRLQHAHEVLDALYLMLTEMGASIISDEGAISAAAVARAPLSAPTCGRIVD